jgi:formylglycine-generating enzyme required for sulfatase activity
VVLTHGFWLAKHPLSQRQWLAVMPKNPSQRGKGDDFPVDTISWNSAQEFCGQAGLHLPTEAQWEYACRAGHSTPFGIGSGSVLNAQMANFDGNYPYGAGDSAFKWCYRGRTLPGGSFPPNAWGLHDMHGQLWEWCEDAFEALPASEEVDPLHVSAGSQRVLRGGGWISNGRLARSAYRYGYAPDSAVVDFGLRPCPSSTSASSRVAERPKE